MADFDSGELKKRSRFSLRGCGGVVVGLVLILLFVAGIKVLQIRKMMAMGAAGGPPPESVASAEVLQKDWQPTFHAVGSIAAVQGAMLSAQVPGVVAEVNFESGADVKKGDLLLRLDAAAEEAQLRSAEADAALAKADFERSRDLAGRKVIAQAELDAAESKLKQRIGAVENFRSIIERKNIRAPFDGKAGIRQVNVGQMATAGQQIVALQSVDPVFVDFALPQQRMSELAEGLPVVVRTDAFPDREFKGKLTAVNSMIDPTTRNVLLQATLENPERLLRAGMFAKVDVILPQTKQTLVIPATAVAYAPFGDSVFVIEKKKDEKTGKEGQVIRQQFIRIGESRGDFVGVTTGLKPGEKVVSAGVFKLRNGMPVQVKDDLAPKPQESPKPADT